MREQWRVQQGRTDTAQREFPSRDAVTQAIESLKGVLYPLRLGPTELRQSSEDFYIGHTLDTALQTLQDQARIELRYRARQDGDRDSEHSERAHELRAAKAVHEFARSCPVCASCWMWMCWLPFMATRRRRVWTKSCSATPACWR